MKKINLVFTILIFASLIIINLFAEENHLDQFYAGLANILTTYQDNPTQCVNSVNQYYLDNQKLIKTIQGNFNEPASSDVSTDVMRYLTTLESFTNKYPQEGLTIARKALELIPQDSPSKKMLEGMFE